MHATALLVMDVQRGVVERFEEPGYLRRLSEAVGAARAAEIPVVYVTIGFRPGYPEISARNATFSAAAAAGRCGRQPRYRDPSRYRAPPRGPACHQAPSVRIQRQ